MEDTINFKQKINWFFISVFILIGILNIIYIHLIPGSIYLLLAVIYLPSTDAFLKTNIGIIVPFTLKIILFLMVIWATLGVGDLFELFESNVL